MSGESSFLTMHIDQAGVALLFYLYKITRLASKKVGYLIGAAGCSYLLPDGTYLRLHSGPAWCRQCRRFANAESMPTVEHLESTIAQLSDPVECAKLFPAPLGPYDPVIIAEMIERQRKCIEWRRIRSSPPRCLRCGSTDITPLPFDQPTPHPGGHGDILVHADFGGGITPRGETLYTPEGILIMEG